VEDQAESTDGVEWLPPEEARSRGLTAATTKILDQLPTLL
jgi:hypothetical protein